MLKRDYPTQYCSMAATLEIIGERWTILIVRDIFLGVRRFDDLQRSLGVARNILRLDWSGWSSTGSCASGPISSTRSATSTGSPPRGPICGPCLMSLLQWGDRYAIDGEPPVVVEHRGCGGELDDRRRCRRCGVDVSVTEALAVRTGGRGAPVAEAHRKRRSGGGPRLGLSGSVGRAATVSAMSEDTTWMDATDQAALVRSGSASPAELVDEAIARIERLNPALNAVIFELFDRARAAAAGDLPDGPFKGVPLLLKDLGAELAGTPFREGTAFAGDYHSTVDQELTTRFLAAGFVVCGKTNTPEFGILPTTEPKRFGPSRNPWNTAHSTGGSSGGSAAAVASGMVPVAHANDGGGSIRIPASCCGLVGLKPTRARVSTAPQYGDLMGGLVAEHVVTRSVRDSAAILDAIAGPVPGDPYWAPPRRGPSFAAAAGTAPKGLRVAVLTASPTGSEVHPDCVARHRADGDPVRIAGPSP